MLDHQCHCLLDVHLDLTGDERPRRLHARAAVRVDAVRHDGERQVAIGDDADGATALADDHRADVAIAHETADRAEAVGGVGGHDVRGHDVPDAHAATVSAS